MLHFLKWWICEVWSSWTGEMDSQCKGGGRLRLLMLFKF